MATTSDSSIKSDSSLSVVPDTQPEPQEDAENELLGAPNEVGVQPEGVGVPALDDTTILHAINTLSDQIHNFQSTIYAKVGDLSTKVDGLSTKVDTMQTDLQKVTDTMATGAYVKGLTRALQDHLPQLQKQILVGLRQSVTVQNEILGVLHSLQTLPSQAKGEIDALSMQPEKIKEEDVEQSQGETKRQKKD